MNLDTLLHSHSPAKYITAPMAERTRTTESGDIIEAIYVAAPGTELLMDEDSPGATERRLHKLQHAKTGDGHIILVPQPSLTDPNDPLLWSKRKKWVVLMNGVAYAFNGAVTGPMMAGGKSFLNGATKD
jgi:hypothetical protein